jgi:hypothetical protein
MTALVVRPVIDRLENAALGGLAALGLRDARSAGDLVSAADQIQHAVAFAVWLGDQAGPQSAGSHVHHQLITTRVAIVCGYTNTGATAANWSDAWDTTRRALLERLCGWVHPLSDPAPREGVSYVSASLAVADTARKTMLCQAVFSFPHFLRIDP